MADHWLKDTRIGCRIASDEHPMIEGLLGVDRDLGTC